MDPCDLLDHSNLIWEVREHIDRDADCIICSVEDQREHNAREQHGPGFDTAKFRFDLHKAGLERLIMDHSVSRIPKPYLDLMRQVISASQSAAETVIRSIPTGVAGAESSITVTVPPADLYLSSSTPTILDPDDVPPGPGWTYMSMGDNMPPEPKEPKKQRQAVVSATFSIPMP